MAGTAKKLLVFSVLFRGEKFEKHFRIHSQDEATAYLWGEKQIKYWHTQFTNNKTNFEESPRKLSVHVVAV